MVQLQMAIMSAIRGRLQDLFEAAAQAIALVAAAEDLSTPTLAIAHTRANHMKDSRLCEASFSSIAIPILLTAACLEASGNRLFPFTELTDEMVARIDLKDGSVEDWLEVVGEPDIDWTGFCGLSVRSLVVMTVASGWPRHGASDHLFVAAEIVDDFYVIGRPLGITAIQQYGSLWTGIRAVEFSAPVRTTLLSPTRII